MSAMTISFVVSERIPTAAMDRKGYAKAAGEGKKVHTLAIFSGLEKVEPSTSRIVGMLLAASEK